MAAAIFKVGDNGIPICIRMWTGGKRPSWVWQASRDMQTLVIDANMPTLADSADDVAKARERMLRIGVESVSEIAVTRNSVVAVRSSSVQQAFKLAGGEGIIADAVTSFMAVELGLFLHKTGTADAAKLVFHENVAFLLTRNGAKLSARRFALPEGMAELNSTLQLAHYGELAATGLLPNGQPSWSPPEHLRAKESFSAKAGDAYSELLKNAAELWLAGDELATFATRHTKASNAAMRWLPPIALSLAILSLAALLPLRDSYSRSQAKAQKLDALKQHLSQMETRAEENAGLLRQIEELSRTQAGLAGDMIRSQRTLASLVVLQDSLKGARRIKLDSVNIDECGRLLYFSGELPSKSNELRDVLKRLEIAHFKPSSDITLREGKDTVAFTVKLEARP